MTKATPIEEVVLVTGGGTVPDRWSPLCHVIHLGVRGTKRQRTGNPNPGVRMVERVRLRPGIGPVMTGLKLIGTTRQEMNAWGEDDWYAWMEGGWYDRIEADWADFGEDDRYDVGF